jgi:hypothetical protein
MIKALVLEGPAHDVMRGWIHFQVIVRVGDGVKVTATLGQLGRGPDFAAALRGKFYERGTWEGDGAAWLCKKCGRKWHLRAIHESCHGEPRDMVHCFPAPRPAVLDELLQIEQREMAL